MKFQTVETIKRNGKTIELIQDTEGFWGWQVGTHISLPIYAYRSVAIMDAMNFIQAK